MDENLYDEFGNYIGPDIPEVDIENISEEEAELKSEAKDENDERPLAQQIIVKLFFKFY